jgi:hypothetical protein
VYVAYGSSRLQCHIYILKSEKEESKGFFTMSSSLLTTSFIYPLVNASDLLLAYCNTITLTLILALISLKICLIQISCSVFLEVFIRMVTIINGNQQARL